MSVAKRKKKKVDPMRTRTGKVRLGPLNIKQLEDMLKSCQPKHRNKIQNRIKFLQKLNYKAPQVEVTEA